MKKIDINSNAGSSTNNRIKKLSFVLLQEINFIHTLMAIVLGEDLIYPEREENTKVQGSVNSAILSLMQGVTSSANTILYLSESAGLHTRDCYGIARSIFETSLNICYIIAAGEKVAHDALAHSRAIAIKDLKRESRVGQSIINVSYVDVDGLSIPPEIKTDLRKFETKKGKGKSWTNLSVDARILFVGNKLGKRLNKTLHMARFMIYKHSSEILHGSVFGCNHFLGTHFAQSKEKLASEFNNSIAQQHELILICCICSLSSIVDSFHHKYGFKNLYDVNRNLLSDLKSNDYDEEHLIVPSIRKS